ncbi:hypothetical protein [Selenomonas ruminantium]|uniref:Uncharacterized protein n=1 Tax=Selenomonas ruminantium TaxID=971 RepID=A0A1H0MZG4_SELRU|nr:hypothetical protein [Selenomonas ruminantium]SDO85838.1 hypothetical protein SAMN05216366_102109 [Selenomonas ruminantium]
MKVVWTEKAEQEYAARHPGKRNQRKAGTQVIYDGKPVAVSMSDSAVFRAYKARGWVRVLREKKHEYIGDLSPRPNNCLSDEAREERWRQLQNYFGSEEKYSMKEITDFMGLTCTDTLKHFVVKYGKEMAARYGKLPYKKGLGAIYTALMEKPPKEPPKLDARVAKQNKRWKILCKEIRQKKDLQQIARDLGLGRPDSLRDFFSKHGERLFNEFGALPYSPVLPKYMRKYMEGVA